MHLRHHLFKLDIYVCFIDFLFQLFDLSNPILSY